MTGWYTYACPVTRDITLHYAISTVSFAFYANAIVGFCSILFLQRYIVSRGVLYSSTRVQNDVRLKAPSNVDSNLSGAGVKIV